MNNTKEMKIGKLYCYKDMPNSILVVIDRYLFGDMWRVKTFYLGNPNIVCDDLEYSLCSVYKEVG